MPKKPRKRLRAVGRLTADKLEAKRLNIGHMHNYNHTSADIDKAGYRQNAEEIDDVQLGFAARGEPRLCGDYRDGPVCSDGPVNAWRSVVKIYLNQQRANGVHNPRIPQKGSPDYNRIKQMYDQMKEDPDVQNVIRSYYDDVGAVYRGPYKRRISDRRRSRGIYSHNE